MLADNTLRIAGLFGEPATRKMPPGRYDGAARFPDVFSAQRPGRRSRCHRVGRDTSLPVAATTGFVAGQSITIGSGVNQETATIAQVQGGRGGARITVTMPLTMAHAANAPLAGSGITLTTPIGRDHPRGAAVTADVPTPGAANRYSNPRAPR